MITGIIISMKAFFRTTVALIVTVAPEVCFADSDAKPIDVGSSQQLLWDDHLVDKISGEISFKLHNPVDRGIALVCDQPWEGNVSGYATIIQDGEKYRMYYRAWHYYTADQYEAYLSRQAESNETEDLGEVDTPEGVIYFEAIGTEAHEAVICYAESSDGVIWTKPELNIVEYNGSKKNNIILEGLGNHNFVPFLDTNPNADPSARFKALGGNYEDGGLFAFASADGIHWRLLSDKPVVTDGYFDSQNIAFWDSNTQNYRLFYRDFRDRGVHFTELWRGIKFSTSQDFKSWEKGEWIEFTSDVANDFQYYTNQIQLHPDIGGVYIGFPSRYFHARDQMVEGLFMFSRDGKTFNLKPEAFVRPGLNNQRWSNRSNYIWNGMVETLSSLPGEEPEYSIYVNEGYYFGADTSFRRYTIRKDGFISLNATYEGGEIITKPIKFSGSQLEINFSTSVAGYVQIELRDLNNEPIAGFTFDECSEIFGDSLHYVVKWDSATDLSDYAGGPVRLAIRLSDADLYSFAFSEASSQ
jgi:hypothetical protein